MISHCAQLYNFKKVNNLFCIKEPVNGRWILPIYWERRRKQMKRTLSFMLVAVLCLAPSLPVLAEGAPSTVTYDEITDVDVLIDMALNQLATQPMVLSDDEEEITTLYVDQLLSRTTFNNGTIQEEYATSAIAIADTNGRQLTINEFVNARTSNYVENDNESYNGIYVVNTTYYTLRIENGGLLRKYVKITKAVATIQNSNQSNTPPGSGIIHCGFNKWDTSQNKYLNFQCSPTVAIQSFTLDCSEFSEEVTEETVPYVWFSKIDVTLVNNHVIETEVILLTPYM